jgi:hypothetical protein
MYDSTWKAGAMGPLDQDGLRLLNSIGYLDVCHQLGRALDIEAQHGYRGNGSVSVGTCRGLDAYCIVEMNT